ncbi:MAG: 4Fe-4S binding protein, partial [bacterium]
KEGCICSIGAIQDITLALFDETYAVPFTVVAFFILPLLFALLFGRVFCAGVCPLGAIQDLVLIRSVKIPDWLRHALGLLAYLYLGAAVLFAALGSAFIICEYDPFVAFFRLSGNLNIVTLGIILLLIGFFVGRPYCLFLCPYSVLLNLLSRLSQWRVTISPDICLQCELCEEACPFGAIVPATPEETRLPGKRDRACLVFMVALAPILIVLGGWVFSLAGASLSRMDSAVRLAEQIVLEDSDQVEIFTDASKAFRETGQPKEVLFREAQLLRKQFSTGAWILGGFMGLVIACKLIGLSIFRRKIDYEVDPGGCLACGRCFSYCPQEIKRQKKNKSARSAQKEPGTIENESKTEKE